MKSPLLRLLFPSLLLAVSAWAQDATPSPAPGQIDPKQIETTLVPEKAAILPGEPVYVSLIVKNHSDSTVTILTEDDFMAMPNDIMGAYYGWSRRFNLTAVDAQGAKVPKAPLTPESRGSLVRIGDHRTVMQHIPPGGGITYRLWLPWRVVLDRPGDYTLTATTELGLYEQKDAIPVAATGSLTVLPPDKEKMGALIDALEKQMAATPYTAGDRKKRAQVEESLYAARKLASINDERVIPYYLQQLKSGKWQEALGAMNALAKFNNDNTFAGLKKGLDTTVILDPSSQKPDPDSLQRFRMAAARALAASPHPGALPFLLSHYNDPDMQVRCIVVEAMATNVPPAGAIPVLRKMAADKTNFVHENSFVGESVKSLLAKLTTTNPR